MATSADSVQRPKFQYSQSFRHQATQDALAEDPPLARGTREQQGLLGLESATATAAKLEDLTTNDDAVTLLSEDNLHHRLNATGSVQAIVVDDDVLFAGLQGGDIVVWEISMY